MASSNYAPPAGSASNVQRCGSDGGSIVYEDGASINDAEELAVLLEDFAFDEPCMAPLRLDRDRLRAVARPWTAALLHDAPLCVVARLVDERVAARGRIVGAAFNFHCEPGHPDDGDGWLGHFYSLPELRAHERFVIQLASRADVCSRYGSNGDNSSADIAAIAIGVLVCARDHRGRGIGGGLVRRSLELAARCGYRLATATATSAYSQRAFEHTGFERVLEASYEELPNALLYSEEHRRLHRSVVVYAQRLLAADALAAEAGGGGVNVV